MICNDEYYLVVNDKLGGDLKSRKVKLKQPLQSGKQKLDRVYFEKDYQTLKKMLD